MKHYLQLYELNREELMKRRQSTHTMMATLAGLFFVWLIVIYWTGFFLLTDLGFVFLLMAILKYIDMRYYDTILRMKELKENSIEKKEIK